MAKKKVRGFKKNAAAIARRQGISTKRAGAILAAGARKASPAAKRRNPRLLRVKGTPKKKSGRKPTGGGNPNAGIMKRLLKKRGY